MATGCGDVLSLEDLKIAKLHQLFEAEVITGKSGGVATGADIDYATNQVTGQSQKTLPAVLRDAGFRPAAFDFTTGGVLSVSDRGYVVYDPVSKAWYSWAGALPKTVPAGTNPLLDVNWRPQTDPNLRNDLNSSSLPGTALVRHSSGNTVAQELEILANNVNSVKSLPVSNGDNFSVKTLFKTFPLYSQNGAEIMSTWGYNYIYPQGFVFDPLTSEFLVLYTAVYNSGSGASVNNRIFIDIYDANYVYQQTVSGGYGFAEGALLDRVSGERRIAYAANGINGKVGVFSLPATGGLTKYQELTKLFDTSSTYGSQISACGDYVAVSDPLISTNRPGATLCSYSIFNKIDFLSSATAPRKSVVHLPGYCTHSPSSSTTPKLQGIAFTPKGFIGVGGSQWYASSPDTSYGLSLQYTRYSVAGDVLETSVYNAKNVSDFISQNVVGTSFIEPEGIVYQNGNLYTLIAHTNPTVNPTAFPNGAFSLFIESVRSPEIGPVLDLSNATLPGAFSKGYGTKACYPYPVNPRNAQLLSNADAIVQMMQDNTLDSVKIGIGVFGHTFTVTTSNGNVVYTSGQAHIYTSDWLWFNIDVTNTNTGSTLEQFRVAAAGVGPYSWAKSPVFFGGSSSITALPDGISGSALQLSAAGSGSRRFVCNGATVVENYYNVASGSIAGGITVGAGSSTTFATTSDMRRKDTYGVHEDVAELISSAVADGAAQLASFKESPDDKYYMMMAQILHKHFPQAVTVGGDDEMKNPWMVDSSFVVPALMVAVAQLTERVKELENK